MSYIYTLSHLPYRFHNNHQNTILNMQDEEFVCYAKILVSSFNQVKNNSEISSFKYNLQNEANGKNIEFDNVILNYIYVDDIIDYIILDNINTETKTFSFNIYYNSSSYNNLELYRYLFLSELFSYSYIYDRVKSDINDVINTPFNSYRFLELEDLESYSDYSIYRFLKDCIFEKDLDNLTAFKQTILYHSIDRTIKNVVYLKERSYGCLSIFLKDDEYSLFTKIVDYKVMTLYKHICQEFYKYRYNRDSYLKQKEKLF